ncbi:hypothetical protein SJAV_00430 [Sulfurisphaera javensis]|uniref:Uncharacterized protein n=1 Tax=Sulfurisphaera javensis TaxID=2049879 RepID=A0AAT9GMH7_9CREN
MKFGRILISISLLIIALGELTFPFSTIVYTNSTFTMPQWYNKAVVSVNNGTFLVQRGINFVLLENGDSIVIKGNFKLFGDGNASIVLKGLKIFPNSNYLQISILLIIVGIAIEIIQYFRGKRKNF